MALGELSQRFVWWRRQQTVRPCSEVETVPSSLCAICTNSREHARQMSEHPPTQALPHAPKATMRHKGPSHVSSTCGTIKRCLWKYDKVLSHSLVRHVLLLTDFHLRMRSEKPQKGANQVESRGRISRSHSF